jgi:hypothetical protein
MSIERNPRSGGGAPAPADGLIVEPYANCPGPRGVPLGWGERDGKNEEVEQSWQSAPGEPPAGALGRDAVVDFIRSALEGMRSTHHGHNPEIEITDASTAVGTWALADYCTAGGEIAFNGAGYYRDEYVKRDGRWLIHRTHLEAEPF